MKLIIDRYIPFVKGVFDNICQVEYLQSADIDHNTVKDADCLIVRTRTLCNEALLKGSDIKLIASATAGYEHIDLDFCKREGIATFVARGCNASSVAQYVGSAVALWTATNGLSTHDLTIGIVGYGYVGKEVEKIAELMGCRVLTNDPPLAKQGYDHRFVSLSEIADRSDVITFHTPLTDEGEFATRHLGADDFFAQCSHRPLIINAARGGVINEQSMLAAHRKQQIGDFVVDCWENEPNISHEVLREALVATPHIAGYSANGKYRASQMCIEAVARFFGLSPAQPRHDIQKNVCTASGNDLALALLANYDIRTDTEQLKASPDKFEYLRNNYYTRYELEIG